MIGVLRGYDAFMNLVLDETVEQGQEKHNLGMVVRLYDLAFDVSVDCEVAGSFVWLMQVVKFCSLTSECVSCCPGKFSSKVSCYSL